MTGTRRRMTLCHRAVKPFRRSITSIRVAYTCTCRRTLATTRHRSESAGVRGAGDDMSGGSCSPYQIGLVRHSMTFSYRATSKYVYLGTSGSGSKRRPTPVVHLGLPRRPEGGNGIFMFPAQPHDTPLLGLLYFAGALLCTSTHHGGTLWAERRG